MQPFPYNVTVIAQQRHTELLAEAERLRWSGQPLSNDSTPALAPLSLRWQECIQPIGRTVLIGRWSTSAWNRA